MKDLLRRIKMSLRNKIIRLAFENPSLRKDLLSLISNKTAKSPTVGVTYQRRGVRIVELHNSFDLKQANLISNLAMKYKVSPIQWLEKCADDHCKVINHALKRKGFSPMCQISHKDDKSIEITYGDLEDNYEMQGEIEKEFEIAFKQFSYIEIKF